MHCVSNTIYRVTYLSLTLKKERQGRKKGGGGQRMCVSVEAGSCWFVFHADVTKLCSINREHRLSEKEAFSTCGERRRAKHVGRGKLALSRFFPECAHAHVANMAAAPQCNARLTARTQRAQRREPNLFHAPLARFTRLNDRAGSDRARVSSSNDSAAVTSLRLFTATKKKREKEKNGAIFKFE